jgi:hypothetical protein
MGTPGDQYAPIVSELFRECEFLAFWINECQTNITEKKKIDESR